MSCNIEMKAMVHDRDKLEKLAAEISDCPMEVIHQHDIFFHSPNGRLKLRILDSLCGQLIAYSRPDSSDPAPSEYYISTTDDPQGLLAVLDASLGRLGEVKKERHLYLCGKTRIHIDAVEDLGDFMELEVVLGEGDSHDEGICIARDIMEKLLISDDSLIDVAYIDLLV